MTKLMSRPVGKSVATPPRLPGLSRNPMLPAALIAGADQAMPTYALNVPGPTKACGHGYPRGIRPVSTPKVEGPDTCVQGYARGEVPLFLIRTGLCTRVPWPTKNVQTWLPTWHEVDLHSPTFKARTPVIKATVEGRYPPFYLPGFTTLFLLQNFTHTTVIPSSASQRLLPQRGLDGGKMWQCHALVPRLLLSGAPAAVRAVRSCCERLPSNRSHRRISSSTHRAFFAAFPSAFPAGLL